MNKLFLISLGVQSIRSILHSAQFSQGKGSRYNSQKGSFICTSPPTSRSGCSMLSKKDPFLSLPVSRVGLSARLNQLAQPNSRPATPATYVSSSLNPNRNPPVTPGSAQNGLKVLSQEEVQKFEELPIVQDIRQFEATLADLSAAVSSFKDDDITPTVKKLIDINRNISEAVSDLETHQSLLQQVTELKSENEHLDREQKDKLRKLISVRASLRLIPGPSSLSSSTSAEDLQGINIQTLLDYSMKLAKFSRAPATVQSQMIHPNNYIWPAEDALRRGMLAMASLKPDELIRAELGEDELELNQDGMEVDREPQNKVPENLGANYESKPEIKRNASSPSKASQPSSRPQQQPAAASLDLDLFDPEDDDSDESNNED